MKKVAICKFEDLIGEEEAISINTMLKMEKLKKEKYLLAVHSKKNINDLIYYNRDFPFIDFIISEKGYYIYDFKKNKKIVNNNINKQLISKICKIYKKNTIKYIGENGIIEKSMIKIEDIYEIDILESDKKLDIPSLNIKNNNNKLIITKKDISYNTLIKELSSKLKIEEKNIIHLTKKRLNEID